MTTQPTPTVTDYDVARVARRDFGEGKLSEVLSILARYGPEQGPESPRVHIGILKLANRTFQRLPACVDMACTDYRDVIMQAEMPNYPYDENNEARAQATIDRDWKNFCEWFEKKGA